MGRSLTNSDFRFVLNEAPLPLVAKPKTTATTEFHSSLEPFVYLWIRLRGAKLGGTKTSPPVVGGQIVVV